MTGLLGGIAMAVVATGLGLGSLYLIGFAIVFVMMIHYLNKVNKGEMERNEIPILKIAGIALLTIFVITFMLCL